jgi:hypothetical protein
MCIRTTYRCNSLVCCTLVASYATMCTLSQVGLINPLKEIGLKCTHRAFISRLHGALYLRCALVPPCHVRLDNVPQESSKPLV